jgi:hypothetical protein
MKLATSQYYQVQDQQFGNAIVIIIKPVEGDLSDACIQTLQCLSQLFNKTTTDICRLQNLDFSKLREPRIG